MFFRFEVQVQELQFWPIGKFGLLDTNVFFPVLIISQFSFGFILRVFSDVRLTKSTHLPTSGLVPPMIKVIVRLRVTQPLPIVTG